MPVPGDGHAGADEHRDPDGAAGVVAAGVVSGTSACWLCDGRIGEHDGKTVSSLGGITVHTRCFETELAW